MFIIIKNKKKIIKLCFLISKLLYFKIIISFNGKMAIGKTTLIKNIINKITKYKKKIKSPTYNIMEIYKYKNIIIQHIDQYNLFFNNLIFINYQEQKNTFTFIEWGNKFKKNEFIDLIIYILYFNKYTNRLLFIKHNKYKIQNLLN